MPIQKFFLYIGIIVFLLTAFLSVSHAESGKYVLENGLTVVIKPMPSNPMVSVYGLIKAGGATEGKYLGSGLSHFLEHMLFKGTEHRGVGEIGKTIQGVGGSINAQTSFDYTMFTITVPREAFDTAVDLLADALFYSSLDAVEMEKERKVVFSEMRLRKDNPDVYLNDLMYRSVYLNHPYKNPVIGYPELFAKVTREDLYDFYKTYYTPNNMVISVAGGVDERKALAKVQSAFGAQERSSPIPRNLTPDPWPISSKFIEEFYPTDLTRIAVVFQSVSLMDSDLFALDVLAKILGQGQSSRLYSDLYQKQGLIYSVSSYNYTPYDRGVFVVEATLDDEKREQVEVGILQHIEKFQKDLVIPAELEKAKKQVESEYVMGQQTTEAVASSLAMDEFLTGDHVFAQKYVDGVRAVTGADIQRVASRYLQSHVRATVILRPQVSLKDQDKASAQIVAPKIQKKVLKNGLVVLLREDHTFPLVSMALSAKGGLFQESEHLNGISALTADTWIKGTSKMSAGQIAEYVDATGMSLDQFSGRNSMGLKMDFLSRDWDRALKLFEDLVRNPAFSDDEIKKAKQLLSVAIRQRQDDIFAYSNSHLKKILFPNHPYGLDQEGTLESLGRITRKDIVDFYGELVSPRNMVLAVYGDIDPEHVFKSLDQRFGSLKDQNVNLAKHSIAPLAQSQEEQFHLDKEQALVLNGFRGAALSSSDVYGLELLTSILGSSFSGRLFNKVRDELGKAYTVGGQFYPGFETGGIVFYVLTTEADVVKVKEVLAQEISRIQNELISEQELTAAKNHLKGNHKSQEQTNGAMSFVTSLDELYGLGFDHYQNYDVGMDQVTAADVQELAKKYLDLTRQVVVITVPTEKKGAR